MLYATPSPTARLVIMPVRTLNGMPSRYIVPRIHVTLNRTGSSVTAPRVALPSVIR
jgi:hypothetical protein